jgi:hypothetical protein
MEHIEKQRLVVFLKPRRFGRSDPYENHFRFIPYGYTCPTRPGPEVEGCETPIKAG